jgi:hypothetical protein
MVKGSAARGRRARVCRNAHQAAANLSILAGSPGISGVIRSD